MIADALNTQGDTTGGRRAMPVLDLGVAPYLPVQNLQQRLREAVADGKLSGLLLLLEHEPVITLGTRAGPQDLRSHASTPQESTRHQGEIDIVKSERGGQATLHAPGQLISYPIVPIPGHDLSAYVHSLEEVLVVLLEGMGIHAHRRKGAPGLYVGDDKIASVGLRCRRWVASHGTSLNVDPDLGLFDLIVSCGDPALRQTSIAALTGIHYTMAHMKAAYVDAVRQVFAWDLLPMDALSHAEVESFLGL